MGPKREHLWVGLLVAVAAVTWFLLRLDAAGEDGRVRVGFERAALERLRAVARAQHDYRERHGRYGWAAELQADGLLPAGWVAEDGSVPSTRYRIDVLLPHAQRIGDLIQIAPRQAGHSNPKLEARHFAAVARPWGAQRSGYRTFYEDERGEVWFYEGVVSVGPGRYPPLPPALLEPGTVPELSKLPWHRLEPAEAAPSDDED